MESEKWKQIKEVFNQIIELDEAERREILNSLSDAEIRREVEKLIRSDSESQTMANLFAIVENSADLSRNRSLVDRKVGNYKILEEICSGGMGTVFLALREDLQKQVALKVVKYEFSSKEIKRRFENERKTIHFTYTLYKPRCSHM